MNTPASRTTRQSDAVSEVVRRSLRAELDRRRDLEAHVQLGVPLRAPRATIDQAFAVAMREYDPARFYAYGPEASSTVSQIADLITTAYRRLTGGNAVRAKPSRAQRVLERLFRRRRHH